MDVLDEGNGLAACCGYGICLNLGEVCFVRGVALCYSKCSNEGVLLLFHYVLICLVSVFLFNQDDFSQSSIRLIRDRLDSNSNIKN